MQAVGSGREALAVAAGRDAQIALEGEAEPIRGCVAAALCDLGDRLVRLLEIPACALQAALLEESPGPIPSLRAKARCQLASSTVTLTAAEVVDLVHSCVGTSGIRAEGRFERYFRDAHVITQHAFVCESRLEAVGQIMFGLEPDWGFFYI